MIWNLLSGIWFEKIVRRDKHQFKVHSLNFDIARTSKTSKTVWDCSNCHNCHLVIWESGITKESEH
jgi:hypothetical protein